MSKHGKGGARHPDFEARAAKLREMWAAGAPVRVIAAAIPGMTANAVAGMRQRLGLPMRGNPVKAGNRVPKAALSYSLRAKGPTQPLKRHSIPVVVEAPTSAPVASARLSQCQFPLWDQSATRGLFCGAAVEAGASYCPFHRARCYTGIPQPKRSAGSAG